MGASITTKTRYVIGVQTDIAGAWEASLSIPNVSLLDQPSGAVIGVELRNDGDVFLLKPSGHIVVTDAAGNQLISQDIEMGTFVPGTDVTYPVAWPGQPAAGDYKVAVELGYAEGKTATLRTARSPYRRKLSSTPSSAPIACWRHRTSHSQRPARCLR